MLPHSVGAPMRPLGDCCGASWCLFQLRWHKNQIQMWDGLPVVPEGGEAPNVFCGHRSCRVWQCLLEIRCRREVNFCNATLRSHSSESALVSVRCDFLFLSRRRRCCVPGIAVNWELECGSVSWKQILVLELLFFWSGNVQASFNALKCFRVKSRISGLLSFNVNVVDLDGRTQLFILLLTMRISWNDTNNANNCVWEDTAYLPLTATNVCFNSCRCLLCACVCNTAANLLEVLRAFGVSSLAASDVSHLQAQSFKGKKL